MGGLSWSELLVIGVVALIVVGPKDLPKLFQNVGRFVGKARGMAREFSRAMNDAANETGVKDVAQTFKSAANPMGAAMDGVKDAANSMMNLDPNSETGKLAAERDEARKKIEATTARKQAERLQKEADAALARANELEPPADAPAVESKADESKA